MVMTHKITLGKDKYHLNKEMMEWCLEFVGGSNISSPTWDMTSVFGNSTYYFKHERDLILFKLRWL